MLTVAAVVFLVHRAYILHVVYSVPGTDHEGPVTVPLHLTRLLATDCQSNFVGSVEAKCWTWEDTYSSYGGAVARIP